jgi:hypothetical protein
MNDNEIDIKKMAQTAIHWASGSWGQGQFDSPRYDDITMAELWYQVAKIATKNSHMHLDKELSKTEKVIEKTKVR